MKLSFLAAVFVCAAACFAQVKLPPNHKVAPPKLSQPVGKAAGKVLTAADVEPYLWEWFGKSAVDDVLSYIAITQEASQLRLSVSDADVEKQIDETIKTLQKSQSGSSQQAFDTLIGQGFPRSRLFVRSKATLLLDKIVLAGFHPENFVKVSTILVRTDTADASAVGKAIQQSQEAYNKLTAGGDWYTVLASVSLDKNLLSTKGELGWRDLSLFPDSVKREILALKDGSYTHPAITQFGVQIFRIDAHGAEAKDKDLDQLKSSFLAAERPKYVDQIKHKANAQVLLK